MQSYFPDNTFISPSRSQRFLCTLIPKLKLCWKMEFFLDFPRQKTLFQVFISLLQFFSLCSLWILLQDYFPCMACWCDICLHMFYCLSHYNLCWHILGVQPFLVLPRPAHPSSTAHLAQLWTIHMPSLHPHVRFWKTHHHLVYHPSSLLSSPKFC